MFQNTGKKMISLVILIMNVLGEHDNIYERHIRKVTTTSLNVKVLFMCRFQFLLLFFCMVWLYTSVQNVDVCDERGSLLGKDSVLVVVTQRQTSSVHFCYFRHS